MCVIDQVSSELYADSVVELSEGVSPEIISSLFRNHQVMRNV